jgi:DNA-binding IclR family transcriptional regulator
LVSKITMILEMLSDGKWHRIEELQQRLELNERKVQEIITFLNKYDFVKIDKEHEKVKINQNFRKLLTQTII